MKLLQELKSILSNDGGFWIPLAMAAYGAYQGNKNKNAAHKQNQAAATQTQFSPWTKMGAGQTRDTGAGALGGAVSGGLSGMAMSQNLAAMGAGGGMGGGAATPMSSGGQEMMVQNAKASSPVISGDPVNYQPQQPMGQGPIDWNNMQQNPMGRTSNSLYA